MAIALNNKNYAVFRGDTFAQTYNFTANDLPLDITGYTLYFTVKRRSQDADADAIIAKDITSHSDPTNGQSLLVLTPDETNFVGKYYYDLQYKKSDGSIYTFLAGEFEFHTDITRRGNP